jgi:hypothetical protein
MFTKNLRFFGQVLHPQWPDQTPKMGQKMDLYRQIAIDGQTMITIRVV